MIRYRNAVIDDAPGVRALYIASFTDTFGHLYSPANYDIFMAGQSEARWLAECTDPAFAVHLAEDDGRLLGFAKLGPPSMPFDPGDRAAIELRQLYVQPETKGAGVGAVLMDWTVAEARRRGAADLWLSVFTENTRARRFYERYGFVEVMPYHFMVGDQADEDIICKLPLDA